jgi:hypothetical protein
VTSHRAALLHVELALCYVRQVLSSPGHPIW